MFDSYNVIVAKPIEVSNFSDSLSEISEESLSCQNYWLDNIQNFLSMCLFFF